MKHCKFPKYLSVASLLLALSCHAQSTTFWVAKDGNDSNACTEAQPCLTIQQGVNKLNAGDTLNVKAGTYYETNSAGVSFFSYPAAIAILKNGTADNPIVIQAAPDDKGEVIIDLQKSYVGFFLPNHEDYIHIKNFVIRNAWATAIVTPDAGFNTTCSEDAKWSHGVVIEGNQIYDTWGTLAGGNNAAIRMYHAKNWTIRNNIIDTVTLNGVDAGDHNEAIISYGAHQALIQNNTIKNVSRGVYWKSNAIGCNRAESQAIIQNNIFENIRESINLYGQERGDGGYNIIRNNIFRLYYVAIYMHGAVNNGIAAIEHNFFDSQGGKQGLTPSDITLSQWTYDYDITINGNIFKGDSSRAYDLRKTNQTIVADYNIFGQNPTIELFRDVQSGYFYNKLTSWQAATAPTVATGQDANSSIYDTSTLANDISTSDYSLPSSSPAIGFMSNGDNAGPYQRGSEIIGYAGDAKIIDITSAPLPPSGLTVTESLN